MFLLFAAALAAPDATSTAAPGEAKRHGLTRTKCIAQIVVDAAGMPESVTFPDCPPPYIDSARAAALEWRWYPTKVDGVAIPIVFTINFVFVLKS